MTIRRLIAAAAVLIFAVAPALGQTSFGHYIGKFVAEFGDDGRKVTLMEPYSYVDPAGEEWNVPDGYKTDGASVPSALWALYPPFTGNYRSAAVIHDYYCDTKERSWQDTHKVFYFAMRAAHVDERTAKIMYSRCFCSARVGGRAPHRASAARRSRPPPSSRKGW